MYEQFHPILCDACNHLSMLGLWLTRASKRCSRKAWINVLVNNNSHGIFSDESTKPPSNKNGSCPGELYGATSWLKYESYCYLPVSQSMSWHNARLHCAKLASSATLVSIHSNEENKFVRDNMPKPRLWSKAGWIGLYHHVKGKTSRWRNNERNGISKHQPDDCLLKRLFRHRSKKTSKLRVAGLCDGN